ncbi:P-II family nitrogen regulator [Pseudomonadota bacterium]
MRNVRVTFIVSPEKEREIEEALKQVEITAMVCMKARGHGAHPNFYSKDWSTEMMLFELFLPKEKLPILRETILTVCDVGGSIDGIFMTSEVSELFT